jgi:hypothetical protein
LVQLTSQSGMVNFELDEEERERDAMRLLVYRNQTAFEFLFNRYAQTHTRMVQELLKNKTSEVPVKSIT